MLMRPQYSVVRSAVLGQAWRRGDGGRSSARARRRGRRSCTAATSLAPSPPPSRRPSSWSTSRPSIGTSSRRAPLTQLLRVAAPVTACGSLWACRGWQQCTERKLAHRLHLPRLPRACQRASALPSERTRLTMHVCLADCACGGHPGKGAQVWQAGAPAVASRHSHAGAQGHQEPLLPPGRGAQCCGSRCDHVPHGLGSL